MTLAMGMIAADGVILAADTRSGTVVGTRLVIATDHADTVSVLHAGVIIASCGEPTMANTLLRMMRRQIESILPNTLLEDVVNKVTNYLRGRYDEWFVITPLEQRPWVAFLVAGYERGKPCIFLLASPHFAPQRCDRGHVVAGCYLDVSDVLRHIDTSAMNTSAIVPLIPALFRAGAQNGLVGGFYRFITLDAEGNAAMSPLAPIPEPKPSGEGTASA